MSSLNSRLQLALISRGKRQNIFQKGFTLVELMIVVVIVGILSGVALPSFLNQTVKAKATECTTKFGSMFSQIAAEAQISVADANTLATALVTDGDTNSAICDFDIPTIATTGVNVFTGTVAGKGDLANKYAANGCVNWVNSKRDIKSATSNSGTAPTAPAVNCT